MAFELCGELLTNDDCYLFIIHEPDAGGLQALPRHLPLEVEAALPVREHQRAVAYHWGEWSDLYCYLKFYRDFRG